MNKIKIERTAKLVQEDHRKINYNILTGGVLENRVWVNAMGS